MSDGWAPLAGALTTDQMQVFAELQVFLDGTLQQLATAYGINAAICRIEIATGVVTFEIQAALNRDPNHRPEGPQT